ncbi:MAG: LacI family DNA-binding transcriptional regulator [Sedimentitalea sp.]
MPELTNKKVDIVAVAKRAKVSISTVSRSFNHPEQVKPSTRKKIDKAVRKLGYIRNRAAQTMHGIRSATIGLVVPTIDHAIFAELVQAFSDAVEAQGFTILLASHGYDLEREYAITRKFLEHRVDGVALIGLDHSQETYHLLASNQIRAISVWNYDANSPLSCVGADNARAGALAGGHVVGLGHRDIGLVFPPTQDNDRARARRNGVEQVLADAGLEVPQAWRLESPYSLSEAKDAVGELLAQSHRPTALICGNDVLALGAIYAAKAQGLDVPGDLSVIGIGDFKGSREMEPPLTSVHLPARDIGRLAGAQLAGSIINNRDTVERTDCPIHLTIRATCRAL